MRILQLCADAGIAPGSTKGAAQHLRGIAAGLSALGHEVVTVAARRPEGPFPVAVHPLDELDGLVGPEVPGSVLVAPAAVDVVYERYSLGHRDGLDLARRLGVPFVLEVNAPLIDEANAHRPGTVPPAAAAVEAELLTAADLVVTVSEALTDWARRRRVGPCLTLVNGFEPSWFPTPAGTPTPTPTPTPARGSAPTGPLVFLGHPKPWHGADRLPGLLAGLIDGGLGPDLVPDLRIIGGGPEIEPILAEAARLGVDNRIEVTGPLPPAEASARLADASIGLAPYRRQEPFYFCPLKVVDYLAAGLPVVATAQGDLPGLVGDAGVVIDPDDDTALVDAVAGLLLDPARRRDLGAAGRERAMRTLTWHRVAERTAAAISDLLDGDGDRGGDPEGVGSGGVGPGGVGSGSTAARLVTAPPGGTR